MQTAKPLMIVDDNPDITCVMKMAFQRNGIVADSFNDPEEALSHFKPGLYSLLLLDIAMPRMNGFRLLQEIRKLDEEIKVCFLSAYDTYDRYADYAPPKIRCVMKKPIGMADLVKHVRLEITPMAVPALTV